MFVASSYVFVGVSVGSSPTAVVEIDVSVCVQKKKQNSLLYECVTMSFKVFKPRNHLSSLEKTYYAGVETDVSACKLTDTLCRERKLLYYKWDIFCIRGSDA